VGFNPHPASLPGDASSPPARFITTEVSIRARHPSRVMPNLLNSNFSASKVSIRTQHRCRVMWIIKVLL